MSLATWRLHLHPDTIAILALIALWLLFFWRLLTPIIADQSSLTQGDFSGQFVAFAAYQYERFSQGQVPLWNPYNNGGLPFIADTQAAVFYPPRLLTLALAHLSGGFSYRALQLEMTAHVLLFTILLYIFMRRVTLRQPASYLASVTAAIVGGYGGFMSGYPPLQLALLEAATWLPLALIGIHEATRTSPQFPVLTPDPSTSELRTKNSALSTVNFSWHSLTTLAYGLSWLAGHPQTTFLMTWLLLAYLGFRLWQARASWTRFAAGAALFGVGGVALAAAQLLPSAEYLALTTRAGFGFDAKANGFPIQDVLQFIYPNVVSVFSPLYVGLVGLALAAIAFWRRAHAAWFWGIAALVALLWSFGGNSLLYPILYNLLPGAYFFRGQERAALIVAISLAVLAGMGIIQLATWDAMRDHTELLRLRLWLSRAFVGIGAVAALVMVAWIGNRDGYGAFIPYFALSTIVAGILSLLLPAATTRRAALFAIAALLVFELFTVNMNADAVYDPVPPAQQVAFTPPPLVALATADAADPPYRVDGFRGLGGNYGSLYGLADIHGISPLWLGSAHALIEGDVPDERSWELFAVRYVFTDWNELPVPSTIVGRGSDAYGEINLHLLDNPRPFALLVSNYELVADDAAARVRLHDPAFSPRSTILLNRDAGIAEQPVQSGRALTTSYAPEDFTISVSTPVSAILSVAHVEYPGWRATLNDQPATILRAYGGLMAVVVPAGESQIVRFTYEPLTYRVGALISLAAWTSLIIFGVISLWRARNR
ncbi:MAG: hypothetical protein SF123_03885 [Chloroflexota bacterium]|nr:hypothetical protein [Chloroflexota bacterium]